MYFYIISCQANILSTVSITKHIQCVNLIIFRGDFEFIKLIGLASYNKIRTSNLVLDEFSEYLSK